MGFQRLTDEVAATVDWVAGAIAARVGAGDDAGRLARPTILLGLASGLLADAIAMSGGASLASALTAVTLTVTGFGTLTYVVGRLERSGGAGGGTRSAGAALLEEWLRRLQALLAAVLVLVVGLAFLGGVVGSLLLVARNVAETGRIGGVLLAISFALLDEPGAPAWLGRLVPAPARAPHDGA